MSATASAHLPSVDEWMTMRAKLVAVIGDTPASTLLSVLPQPVEGGFASNGRLDQMETRLRGEIVELRAEMRTELANVRTEISKSAAETLKSMRALFFQLIGVMCTLGGFAIAAAKLL
jgi:hypothetical protein